MRMSIRLWTATLLIGFTTVLGCHDSVGVASSGDLGQAQQGLHGAAAAEANGAMGSDRANLEMGDSVPGFAGISFDSGTVVLHLLAADQDHVAAKALAANLLRWGKQVHSRRVVAERYTFRQLYEWRVQLRPLLLTPGVVSLGVDIVANRVSVGVSSADARRAVMLRAKELGMPNAALAVKTLPASYGRDMIGSSSVAMSGAATLRSKRRPVDGGYQISYRLPQNDTTFVCSVGWNIHISPYTPLFFITASHCGERFHWEGTRYYQADFLSSNSLGFEWWDRAWTPAGTSGTPGCNYINGGTCRFSDAIVAEYDASIDGHLGFLAKPNVLDGAETNPNLLVVDNTTGRMEITGTLPYPFQGEEVHHIGRTTGWHSGTVIAPCADLQRTDARSGLPYVLWCQSFVTALTGPGDSGGPAFYYRSDLNTATIAGMVFAGGAQLPNSSWTDGFWMSATENIEADYGSFAVR